MEHILLFVELERNHPVAAGGVDLDQVDHPLLQILVGGNPDVGAEILRHRFKHLLPGEDAEIFNDLHDRLAGAFMFFDHLPELILQAGPALRTLIGEKINQCGTFDIEHFINPAA